MNLRSGSVGDLEDAVDRARSHAARVALDHDVHIDVHGGIHRPAKPWSEATARLASLVDGVSTELGQPLDFLDTGGVCDGNNLAALGLGVIDTLGVQGIGDTHRRRNDRRVDIRRLGGVAGRRHRSSRHLARHSTGGRLMRRVRSVTEGDFDALAELAESIDGNMTTMPRDRERHERPTAAALDQLRTRSRSPW